MTGRALVTGGAGFIGSHLVDLLLEEGWEVVVADNFHESYPSAMKRRNIAGHRDHASYSLHEIDVRDSEGFDRKIQGDFTVLVHLAAKAGPRQSLLEPQEYESVNVEGTRRLLAFAHRRAIPQFVFASSSSVYGANTAMPWHEDTVTRPISPYAHTKRNAELLGREWSDQTNRRFIALRFFTVYGPRQRPDLAIRHFAERMLRDEEIQVFGDGSARRDFTLVGDLIRGVRAAMDFNASLSETFNLGSNRTIGLLEMINALEEALDTQATIQWCPPQEVDVPATWADISKAQRLLGYGPATPFRDGIQEFARWLFEQHRTGNQRATQTSG